MLNIEKYKDQILKSRKENLLTIECAIGKIRGAQCKGQKCIDCYLSSINWLFKEYKEPVLDEVEKEYLTAVIKPFRSRVDGICKMIGSSTDVEYILIYTKDNDYASLPNFPRNTMYNGMESMKRYTLEELGL